MNLFQQAEQGFDKLFGYNRQQAESFDYHNMMKNDFIIEQLKLQEQDIQFSERKIAINQDNNQENLLYINIENTKVPHITIKQESNTSVYPSFNKENKQLYDSFISIALGQIVFSPNQEEQIPKTKKKRGKGMDCDFFHLHTINRVKVSSFLNPSIAVAYFCSRVFIRT